MLLPVLRSIRNIFHFSLLNHFTYRYQLNLI